MYITIICNLFALIKGTMLAVLLAPLETLFQFGGEHQIRLLTEVARQTQAAPEYERWILQASLGGGQPIDGFFDVKPAWVVSSVSLWSP